MIDLMCLRQSYERRDIVEIRWIDDNINSADAMTKLKSYSALIKLIDINIIDVKTIEWVDRTIKRSDEKKYQWEEKSLMT
jgi:wyosine [tRNA(Phe)-imidazoG37] synthetase (radical SAM superfamily)